MHSVLGKRPSSTQEWEPDTHTCRCTTDCERDQVGDVNGTQLRILASCRCTTDCVTDQGGDINGYWVLILVDVLQTAKETIGGKIVMEELLQLAEVLHTGKMDADQLTVFDVTEGSGHLWQYFRISLIRAKNKWGQ